MGTRIFTINSSFDVVEQVFKMTDTLIEQVSICSRAIGRDAVLHRVGA